MPNDQISHLRRQEAPQPAHALDFAYLVGDTLFELLVQFFDFRCSLTQLLQQPRVFDGNDGLGGEAFDEFNLFVGKRPHFLPIDGDDAD